MAAGETIGEPISYGDCVYLMLDADDGARAPKMVVYECQNPDYLPHVEDSEHYTAPCSFVGYNDQEGITCTVGGECSLAILGLARAAKFLEDNV